MTHEDIVRITDLIGRVAQNRTVLMVEHNLIVVSNLSHVITVLQRGEILAEGPYEEVSRMPEVISAYLGTGHGCGAAGGTDPSRLPRRIAPPPPQGRPQP